MPTNALFLKLILTRFVWLFPVIFGSKNVPVNRNTFAYQFTTGTLSTHPSNAHLMNHVVNQLQWSLSFVHLSRRHQNQVKFSLSKKKSHAIAKSTFNSSSTMIRLKWLDGKWEILGVMNHAVFGHHKFKITEYTVVIHVIENSAVGWERETIGYSAGEGKLKWGLDRDELSMGSDSLSHIQLNIHCALLVIGS